MGDQTKRRTDGPHYTQEDIAQFERLMGFKRSASAPAEATAENPGGSFHYSEDDNRQFRKLMEFHTPKGGNKRSNQRGNGTYTDSDQEYFERLTPDSKEAGGAAARAAEAPKTPSVPAQYTTRDLEVFSRLMPGDRHSNSEPGLSVELNKDRDVGPIRIVDTDSEREKERRNRSRRDQHIKVRYFE